MMMMIMMMMMTLANKLNVKARLVSLIGYSGIFLYRYRYAVPVCNGKQGSKYTTALETSKYDQQAVIHT